jgi:hypothetical protein|tara:strand:- start:918 stop:2288 length:1371 start_codon:yes stop_codon:yes gene_type:complete
MSLINQAFNFGRRLPVVQTGIDVLTSPRTYQAIGGQIDDVLKRALPGKFRGAGIQNAPTKLIGEVSDIAEMAPGAAREAARNNLQRKFQMAGRLDDAVRPTGGQASTGALRAPGIPNSPRSFDLTMPRGARATSGSFAPDLNSTFQGPALPGGSKPGLLQRMNPLRNPGRLLNPGSLRGGILYGAVAEPIMNKMGLDEQTQATVQGALFTPGGPVMKGLGAMVANDMYRPVADGTLTSPEAYASLTPLERRSLYGGSGDMDAGPEKSNTSQEKSTPPAPVVLTAPQVEAPVPSAPPNAPLQTPITPFPQSVNGGARAYTPGNQAGNVGATYGNGTSTVPTANPANTVLPPNAEQILQADPMQIYGQARSAAVGQDQNAMNKVRDLGLALHRQQFPNLYETPNSVPAAMTAKDQGSALNEIEPSQIDQALLGIYEGKNPVLDPNKFLQVQLQGRVAR